MAEARPLCGAKTRQGHLCRKVAGYHTDHLGFGRCKFHGGAHRNGRVAAAREAAAIEGARLGLAIETDPLEALSMIVNVLAGQVAFVNNKVEEIEEGKELEKGDLHPLVRTLNELLERLRAAAKTAADAGVQERQVRIDEFAVEGFATYMQAVLEDIELSSDQQALVPAAMKRHRELLDSLGERPRELTR